MKKLQKPISYPVKVFYCLKCGEQLKPYIDEKWFDVRSGDRCVNFIWRCMNAGLFNKIIYFSWRGHTIIKTAEDGTELSEYNGM